MMSLLLALTIVAVASAFSQNALRSSPLSRTTLSMKSNDFQKAVGASLMGASLLFGQSILSVQPASAEIDYDGVKYLGGGDKIDINNANIRAYLKVPGLYPTIASKLVKNGPYKSVADVEKIPELSSKELEVLKKAESKFVALDIKPEYVIDKINNGLYR